MSCDFDLFFSLAMCSEWVTHKLVEFAGKKNALNQLDAYVAA